MGSQQRKGCRQALGTQAQVNVGCGAQSSQRANEEILGGPARREGRCEEVAQMFVVARAHYDGLRRPKWRLGPEGAGQVNDTIVIDNSR